MLANKMKNIVFLCGIAVLIASAVDAPGWFVKAAAAAPAPTCSYKAWSATRPTSLYISLPCQIPEAFPFTTTHA